MRLWPSLLILVLLTPGVCAAQCGETPAVEMDERTAKSHLLAKREPELPAGVDRLLRRRVVIVLVTVDREGAICDARPVRGPEELRKAAVEAVKKHWKYRPFLVNWKPVVARFPVSVTFAAPKKEPNLKAKSDVAPRLAWQEAS
jgi:hypothetical protein